MPAERERGAVARGDVLRLADARLAERGDKARADEIGVPARSEIRLAKGVGKGGVGERGRGVVDRELDGGGHRAFPHRAPA